MIIKNNSHEADTVSLKGTSFISEGVKQWELKHHDDFESDNSLYGWSDKRTSNCNKMTGRFLGGHCNFSFNEVTKTFPNLPEHSTLRINASFHMLDAWNGEKAFMKVNNEVVWSRTGKHSKTNGLNICGGDFNDPAFAL